MLAATTCIICTKQEYMKLPIALIAVLNYSTYSPIAIPAQMKPSTDMYPWLQVHVVAFSESHSAVTEFSPHT